MFIYTTAPKDYDWGFTTEVNANVGTASNGKTIRGVTIPDSRVDDQVGRYQSGLHMAVDETEWKKLVDYKLVKLA